MPFIVVVLLLLLITAVIAYRFRLGWLFILPASIVFGLLGYFFVGIGVPRYSGVGRFYSVPFGQEHIGDADIVLSVICWIGFWALLMFLISRRRRR